ncbi:MAG: hypothetical protein COS14_03420 [Bacteroidetes bacterium CG02_land_8_20_14_3_00_31_25]|nr:MAG: hypothetical protein COS14_03420 [Bacteroidetes bacterium CG02_land_8_20_14_3_00_31_25]PIY04895.1 MAG: hypothetical protein COZ21_05335 [Bacteroidetes bacterium CG_4_10_14_3_um_filter_31_20]
MRIQVVFLMTAIIVAFNNCSLAQKEKEPWSENQLIQPADLAKIINDKNIKKPIIFSIGYDNIIKGSFEIGATTKQSNLDKLQAELSKLSADADIVIYCGCCPFKNCPNIRPAFKLLNNLKFTNHKLLNLSQNLKVDWIDKGYPVNK